MKTRFSDPAIWAMAGCVLLLAICNTLTQSEDVRLAVPLALNLVLDQLAPWIAFLLPILLVTHYGHQSIPNACIRVFACSALVGMNMTNLNTSTFSLLLSLCSLASLPLL